MKTCETCIHHDQTPIPLRAWQNGRYTTTSIVEYACKLHVPSRHYKSDYCPDHMAQTIAPAKVFEAILIIKINSGKSPKAILSELKNRGFSNEESIEVIKLCTKAFEAKPDV